MTSNQKDENKLFKSLLISKMYGRHSAQIAEIAEIAESELPQGDVEVNVDCSSINYKEALILPVQCPPAHILNIRPGIRSC